MDNQECVTDIKEEINYHLSKPQIPEITTNKITSTISTNLYCKEKNWGGGGGSGKTDKFTP